MNLQSLIHPFCRRGKTKTKTEKQKHEKKGTGAGYATENLGGEDWSWWLGRTSKRNREKIDETLISRIGRLILENIITNG